MPSKAKPDMSLFLGAHLSIAGGLHNAPIKARDYGCDALQIFTKNATSWKERDVSEQEIGKFSSEVSKSGIRVVLSHASYLINLASPDETTYEQSIRALQNELCRSERLGISGVIVHPGAHKGQGETHGLRRISEGINRIFSNLSEGNCRLLLETTAGQGTSLGWRFDHLDAVAERVSARHRIGFCLDTSHVFSAGYDLRTRTAYEQTMAAFDKTVGLEHLLAIHLNDSKKDLAGRVDRHEHIGKGKIGTDAFRFIMNDTRLRTIPKIIETPKKDGLIDCDAMNLACLRSLVSLFGDRKTGE